MINWAIFTETAFKQNFESMFTQNKREHYVDDEVNHAEVDVETFSEIAWEPIPKHFVTKTSTDMSEEVGVNVYQWNGGSALQRAAVLITEEGDFVGIIDNGKSMLYVANVGCHPIVATNTLVFLNSDGSTFINFPEQLLKQNGVKVVEYLVKTAKQFILQQQH